MRPELFHQSQLPPAENKFHQGNGDDGKHYWLTPPALLAELSAEFGPFDFDPCPYPLPAGFDGLTCEWGQRNYVNPPFGSIVHQGKKKGPTAWVRKAIEEWRKGKTVVLVYPVDKWILMILREILGDHAEVRNLGDVKWLATEDGSTGKGTGRHIACFVLRPANHSGVPAVPATVSIDVLRQHWLRAMECDHATGQDKPHCSCSQVDLGWHPSIGAAVEAWLAHVSGVRVEGGTSNG